MSEARLTPEELEFWLDGISLTRQPLIRGHIAALETELAQSRKKAEALGLDDFFLGCSDCKIAEGEQHRPSCHRQGIVSANSDYSRSGRVQAHLATLASQRYDRILELERQIADTLVELAQSQRSFSDLLELSHGWDTRLVAANAALRDAEHAELEARIAELVSFQHNAEHAGKIDYEGLEAENKRLREALESVREIIEDAPHDGTTGRYGDPECGFLRDHHRVGSGACNCWKSAALSRIAALKGAKDA